MKEKSHIEKDALPLEEILNSLDVNHRQVIRHLANKPSPAILHTFDNGAPTDYYADFVWHSLYKEKSYRNNSESFSGIIQPNTDIIFMPGFAKDRIRPYANPVSNILIHSHDLVVEDILSPAVEFSWMKARMYYMPVTSSGMLARIEITNRGVFEEYFQIFQMLIRSCARPLKRFQREYYHSYGSINHSVFVSAGKMLKCEYNKDKDILYLVYDEHEPKKHKPVGKILCAFSAEQAGEISFSQKETHQLYEKTDEPYCSGFMRDICIKPNETKIIRLAIQFQRFDGNSENPYIPAINESDANKIAKDKISALFATNELEHIEKSLNAYKKYPVISLPERKYEAAVMASLDLPRGSTYNPTGKMHHPFYNFCRTNASDSYEWWNYGQHAHESISLINAMITNPQHADEMLMNHFDMQKPDGKIPYGVRQTGMLDLPEATMPILGWLAWNIYLWSGDKKCLRKAFNSCQKFHKWWMKNRTDGKSMLCNWFSSHETVRDIKEMPVWNVIPVRELLAIDLNSFILREEEVLSEMALELGDSATYSKYRDSAEERRCLINELMWDEKDKCYFGIGRQIEQKVRVKDIAVLIPLFAGVPSKERAKHIAEMISDPAQFGTPYPVPTLSVSDPDFGRNVAPPDCGKTPNVQGAAPCMGDNWPELTYLVVEGLERYGYYKLAADIAYKNLKMVCDTLIRISHFREHYDSISGFGTGLYDYIWSSIASAFLIRFIYGIRPEAKGLRIRPELPTEWDFSSIKNLRIRNSIINLEAKSGKNVLSATVNGRKARLNPDDSVFIPWNKIAKNVTIEYICKKMKG